MIFAMPLCIDKLQQCNYTEIVNENKLMLGWLNQGAETLNSNALRTSQGHEILSKVAYYLIKLHLSEDSRKSSSTAN